MVEQISLSQETVSASSRAGCADNPLESQFAELVQALGREGAVDILQAFLNLADAIMGEVLRHIENQDRERLLLALKELSNTSTVVGASLLQQSCCELALVAQKSDWQAALAVRNELQEKIEHVRRFLKHRLRAA